VPARAASFNPKVRARIELGKKRMRNVLLRHVIAPARTLEQKIADAGPFNQRIEPNLLTLARGELEKEGIVKSTLDGGLPWYFLAETPPDILEARLNEQRVVHAEVTTRSLKDRIGQTLEIAIFRAMCEQHRFGFLGGFLDLDEHDDSQRYKKEEPPSLINGLKLSTGRLDFVFQDPQAGNIGVEAKNIREWI
jgi:hypothetical protein